MAHKSTSRLMHERTFAVAHRRVVTGFNADGKSIILSDGPTPKRIKVGEAEFEELWAFDGIPANLTDPTDSANVETFRISPAVGRIASRIFTIPSASQPHTAEERKRWLNSLDFTETVTIPDDPGMHQTRSIDVTVVISGEMDLMLDSGTSAHLKPGDSVIQRGTMHAWRNLGSEPCVAVAFMVRAE